MFAVLGAVGCGDSDGEPTGPGGPGAGGSTGGAGAQGGMGGAGAAGGAGGGGMGGGGMGGSGGSGGYGVVVCPDPLPAPGATTCTVDQAGTGVLLRGTVLGPDEMYRGGQVLVSPTGYIECVGCDCASAPGASEAAVVTCSEGVISPGLINPHDHITFANNAPADHGTVRYDHRHEWRLGLNGKPEINTNGTSPADVVRFAELRFIMSGATSGATAGGQPGLLRNLDTANGLEGLLIQTVDSDTFPLNDASGIMQTSGCTYGNNPTTADDIAGLEGYLPHIAEGISAAAHNEMFCTQTGNLDIIEPQTGVIHAVGVRPDDVLEMRNELATLIWSPRSNVDLYGNTAPVTLFDNLGVPIALGTDWMPSGSMNMSRELKCADELNKSYFDNHFDDVALWRMVTTNAAIATGTHDAIGMLKKGYVADIAIFDASTVQDHRAIIEASSEDVVLVLRGGEVLYGDDALVASAAFGGAACEVLDVCGVSKRACVAQDLANGKTLDIIRTAGEAFYPLFFCGEPTGEPSCVPYRPEYASGITATDGDGDGIDDAADLCPTVFDPIRPMDGGTQADADDDGIGDACDPCPLDAAASCALLEANDIDGDGVPNGTDNCPELANPDQADADDDGHGDACDGCADLANPGPFACPAMVLPIPALRDPSHPDYPGLNAAVSITNAYVTAIRPAGPSGGFHVQDTSLQPFSGIFIFTGNGGPTLQVGNRVSVTGVLEDFFGLAEITGPQVVVDDPGTSLPFGPIAIANPATIATGGAQAEGYESMLLSIGAVTILVQNSDAPQDFDEFTVTGNLRIDDQIFAALDNTCAVGTAFTGITGIGTFSFSNYKLLPRQGSDIGVSGCSPF